MADFLTFLAACQKGEWDKVDEHLLACDDSTRARIADAALLNCMHQPNELWMPLLERAPECYEGTLVALVAKGDVERVKAYVQKAKKEKCDWLSGYLDYSKVPGNQRPNRRTDVAMYSLLVDTKWRDTLKWGRSMGLDCVFMYACRIGHLKSVQSMFPMLVQNTQQRGLAEAAVHGHKDLVEFFLEHIPATTDQSLALRQVVGRGSSEMVTFLAPLSDVWAENGEAFVIAIQRKNKDVALALYSLLSTEDHERVKDFLHHHLDDGEKKFFRQHVEPLATKSRLHQEIGNKGGTRAPKLM